MLSRYVWNLNVGGGLSGSGEELARIQALLEKAEKNPDLQKEPMAVWTTTSVRAVQQGLFGAVLNDGRVVSDDYLYEHLLFARDTMNPLMQQAYDQSIGTIERAWGIELAWH